MSSLPPVKDKPRRPSFFLFWFVRGSPSLSRHRLLTPSPPGASSRIAGAPPDPPPLPGSSIVASPSPSSSPASPSHGEQYSPLNFPSPSALWRAHKLAGAAEPPPSGAGRRRSTSASLEFPNTCACIPTTQCTGPWSIWWPGTLSRGCADEPPPRAAAQPVFPARPPPHPARTRPEP
jgi:hypothetical protein